MTATCSTREASERTGLTLRQLNHYASRGHVNPPRHYKGRGPAVERRGQAAWLRWRPVDLCAAERFAAVISDGGEGYGPVYALARLVSTAVYTMHGVAPWAVVALPDTIIPAWTAEQVVAVAERFTSCTVVPLPDPLDD